jgi:hypothetical protein
VDEAQIDAFVPLLVGHYDSMCVVFPGQLEHVQAGVAYLLSIPHPSELIVGLTTSEMLASLADVEGWDELGSLAAWCVAQTGVLRINLDVEWSAQDYIHNGTALDFAAYEAGLRAFAAWLPDVEVYFYPPNWEGASDSAAMEAVLRRTRLINSAYQNLPNFHAVGASLATYDSYLHNPHGEEYRSLEAFWSAPPGSVEQIMVINDTCWEPDTLRPILPTIPRECWIYLEPPYNAAKAERLIRCLEPPSH